ncbi:MAG: ATP-grasp domain-containing protein [Methylotenera sp.]|nr:ATP-grasp domain-containing protein [Methylotenera sp.]
MEPPLKLFVCEFITGGGFCAEALPESLVKEGALMRDALLRDLIDINEYDIITTHDVRLGASSLVADSIAVEGPLFQETFSKVLAQADLVWLIAPETEGILLSLSELCYESKAVFLGCGFDATLTGTSKSLSYEAMQAANIYTLPTVAGDDFLQQENVEAQPKEHFLDTEVRCWVVKPEDGAGCDGIRIFDDEQALKAWLKQDDRCFNYLVQPYQQGLAASFSMMCRDGKGWLLSCNQQHISRDSQTFTLTGVTLNGMQTYWKRFDTIARKIAKMLPDATGYIGVDVIVDTENDKIYVVEINPRLTTSYVGLREAIGCNPAKIILDSFLAPHFDMPIIQKNIVEIML